MKKAFSIWLLIVLFAPALVTISWLKYQKKMVKREVKWNMIAGLDRSELVLFKFTKSDSASLLRWEHDKEFEYQQEMYDIAEREIKGDTTYYYCWWDHEETKLNKQLHSLLTDIWDTSPKRHDQEKALFSLYKSLFLCQPPIEPSYYSLKLRHVSMYNRAYINPSASPPVPPPEFCIPLI